jgi:hypothetical protein
MMMIDTNPRHWDKALSDCNKILSQSNCSTRGEGPKQEFSFVVAAGSGGKNQGERVWAHMLAHTTFISKFLPRLCPKSLPKESGRHSNKRRTRTRTRASVSASGSWEEMEKKKRSLMWFRKGLRLHDNPALLQACEGARNVYPVFVLDPWFLAPDPSAPSPGSRLVGVNRIRFLLESLQDLDTSLRNCGSRLLLIHGSPISVIPHLLTKVHTILSSIAANCETYANTCTPHAKHIPFSSCRFLWCLVTTTSIWPSSFYLSLDSGVFLCAEFCSGKLMSYALSMTLSHMLRRGMHRSRCTSHLVEEDFCFLICKWNGLMIILITKGMYDHRFVT